MAGMLLLALYFWQRFSLDRHVQTWIVRYLEARFYVDAQIDSAHLDLTSGRFTLRGLKINSKRFPTLPPPIMVEEIEVRFAYDIRPPFFGMRNILVRAPNIRVREDPDHGINLINMFKSRASEGKRDRFTLKDVGSIAIENGTLFYLDKHIPLETRGGGLTASFFYRAADNTYHVDFDAEQLALRSGEQMIRNLQFETEFHIENETAIFHKLRFASDLGKLETKRGYVNYHDLRYDFEGESRVNLSRVTYAPFRRTDLQGVVDFSGRIRGVRAGLDLTGTVAVDRFQVRRYSFAGISAAVHMTSEGIVAEELRGGIFGGSFQSRLVVGFKAGSISEATGQIRGARIETVLALLAIPVNNIRGEVRAQFNLHWPRFDFAESAGSITADYSGQLVAATTVQNSFPQAFQESVSYLGSARITQAGTSLKVEQASAVTPQTHLQYSGNATLDGDYDLKLYVQTKNGDELLQIAALFSADARRQLQQREITVHSSVDFDGTMVGRRTDFRLAGHGSASQMQVKNVKLSHGDATVEWTPRFLRLEGAAIQLGDSAITGSLRYPFVQKGERIEANMTIRNAPIADLLSLGNWNYPVDGILGARIQFRGLNLNSMEGTAQVSVQRPVIYREPLESFTAAIRFHDKEYSVEDLRIQKGGGVVSGVISGRTDTKEARVQLYGRQISLSSIRYVNLSKYQLAGALNFALRGNGGWENLNYTLRAEVSNFRIRVEHLQNLVLDARGLGQRIDFTANSSFRDNRMDARGTILVTGDYPFQATLELHNAPIHPYLVFFRPTFTADIDGLATGKVQAYGALKQWQRAAAEARLSTLQLIVNRYQLHNEGEVQLEYLNGLLEIKPTKMVGPDTSLNISGQVSTVRNQPINVRIAGGANLMVLAGFIPDLNAGGRIELNVYAGGTIQQPRILGSAAFEKGYFMRPDWPSALFDVNGQLRFTANQVSVESFTTKTRFGTLHVEGGMSLEGAAPTRGHLNITGESLRIEYPQDVKCTIDVDVDFLKSTTHQLLTGVLYIRDAAHVKNTTLADLIMQISNYRALPPVRTYGQQDINLDLDVEAYKTIRIKNNLADALGSGAFNVRGTIHEPVILGRLNVDQGKLVLQDNKFEITRGAVNFNNPRKITPSLDFEAETNVRDYTVTINLRGPIDHLTTSFRSDPPLTTSDIISMLAIGRPIQEVAPRAGSQEERSQTLAFHGASTFLTRSLTEKLAGRSTRLFGFDRFTVDPFIFTGTSPGARVTLGKQISKNVSLIFATDLSSTQNEVVTVEYTIREGVTLVATRNETGAFGLDVKLRKRF
ncbi:MAG: translocation/assembly module TamB domain-containing protein [Acidobacteria bacterium]|nr:translocation/assembly module TamB domain-containing protein [Acidobacteriota bacterium]